MIVTMLPSLFLSHALFESIRYLEMRVRLSALNTLVGSATETATPLHYYFEPGFLLTGVNILS